MTIKKIYTGSTSTSIEIPKEFRGRHVEIYLISREETPEAINETSIPLSKIRRKQIKEYCRKRNLTYDECLETLILKSELIDSLD